MQVFLHSTAYPQFTRMRDPKYGGYSPVTVLSAWRQWIREDPILARISKHYLSFGMVAALRALCREACGGVDPKRVSSPIRMPTLDDWFVVEM